MPEASGYQHGVPSWVDMGSPDLAGSVAFYSSLFGWEGHDLGEQAGHYTMMSKGGKLVTGLGPAQDPGQPRWTTYVNVDDIEAVTKSAEGAGGEVVVAPMDVMTAGRMAIYKDVTGAVIAAWQAGEHTGAQLVNEPGAFTWSELSSSDLARSEAFYSDTFGWVWHGSDQYREAEVIGGSIAGAMSRRPETRAEVPDFWLVYFGARDLDADVRMAGELGASVVVPPTEIPSMGRFAVLSDPQGGVFALYHS